MTAGDPTMGDAARSRGTPPLRAVSFDAAGTLIHTARPVGDLYASVAARHGVHVDPEALHTRFRVAFGEAPPLAFPGVAGDELRRRERAWWRSVVAEVFAGATFDDFDAFFDELFAFFASAAAWRVDPDAHEVLTAVRARGLRVLVVSNFDDRVRGLLRVLGLAPLIDRVTISSEAGAAKPDPRIFTRALADAGLAPGEVVHVGDTVREDLRACRAAGIRVLLVGDAELRAIAEDTVVVPRLADVVPRLADAR